MITIQIREHFNTFIRKHDPDKDKLVMEFSSVKEALKFYKTMGCTLSAHYFIVKEEGIPGLLLHPCTSHFKAAGEPTEPATLKREKVGPCEPYQQRLKRNKQNVNHTN